MTKAELLELLEATPEHKARVNAYLVETATPEWRESIFARINMEATPEWIAWNEAQDESAN